MINILGMSVVQFRSVEDTGVPVAENVASEAHPTFAITEDRINSHQAVSLVIGDKAVTGEFHRSGVASQPKIAARVFVEGSDFVVQQSVPGGVCVKSVALIIPVGEKLDQAAVGCHPEPPVRSFKELVNPFSRPVLAGIEISFRNYGRGVHLVGNEAKEAAVSRPSPQLPRLICEQILNVLAR